VRERVDRTVATVGSAEAFEDFFVREYGAVVGLAYALCGNRALAEDLAQEAFLAAHRNWSRLASYERPGAWIRRVVANLSVSAIRRRVVEAKGIVRLAARERPQVEDLPASDAAFWTAVRKLSRRQAQVVALFYVDDLPVAEIAQILDVSVGSVKKHLHEGRRALAAAFGTDEEEP
jgi:RNA polymerase sigma factor (sigma-70 family)